MIYNHEKNLKATQERIRNSSICEANKQHIFEFESFCFSDGIRIPKDTGSFFEEIWLSSDKKEWNGEEWISTNPDADLQISGYHITQ